MAADEAAGAPSGNLTLAEEQRDVARTRILHAARRALAARGLATTVEEVAEAAGVSRRTVFRHFATRERLFAATISEGLRVYSNQIPRSPGDDIDEWLDELLLATHRANARNGRIYWELAAFEPELTGELAAAAAERREARKGFADRCATILWRAYDGAGDPPPWLVDTVAVHLSGFTTQSLAGDFGRDPDDVAAVSARVIKASLATALADARG